MTTKYNSFFRERGCSLKDPKKHDVWTTRMNLSMRQALLTSDRVKFYVGIAETLNVSFNIYKQLKHAHAHVDIDREICAVSSSSSRKRQKKIIQQNKS